MSKVGHHFNSCRNRERQVTRRRNHFVQDSFGLDSNSELIFERLKVNVAGMVLNRQQQNHVQQLADGCTNPTELPRRQY